jgi:hypothetical protein
MDIKLLDELLIKDRIKINLHHNLKLNSIKFIKAFISNKDGERLKLQRQKAVFLTFYEPNYGIITKFNNYVLCKEFIKLWLKRIDEKELEEIKSDIIFLKNFIANNISNWTVSFNLFNNINTYESEVETIYLIRYLSSGIVSEKLDKAIIDLIIKDRFMLSYYQTNNFFLNEYKNNSCDKILYKFLEDIDTIEKLYS